MRAPILPQPSESACAHRLAIGGAHREPFAAALYGCDEPARKRLAFALYGEAARMGSSKAQS